MRVLRADHARRLQLEGVPEPVLRPVDIDQAQTGFTALRSLRIYRFNAGSTIDGHAEEDELLLVVLAGSIELTLSAGEVDGESPRSALSAVDDPDGAACVAYLPPGGAYRLLATTDAEIAYARATPRDGNAPAAFAATRRPEGEGEILLFEEANYARHLRLRVVQVRAGEEEVAVMPLKTSEVDAEALLHVRSTPAQGRVSLRSSDDGLSLPEPTALATWDTASVSPGERPTVRIAPGSTAQLLIVIAAA